MSIRCALSENQLKNLYKHVYKSMTTSESFDALEYVRSLFTKIKENSETPEEGINNAIKFVEVVPRMIAQISFLSELKNVNIDLNAVRDLMVAFENPVEGFKEIVDAGAAEKAVIGLKHLYNNRFTPEVIVNDNNVEEAVKLPNTSFATTNQQLEPQARDSSKAIERRNIHKKKVYDVYTNITENSVTEDLSFDPTYIDPNGNSKKVALKAIKLDTLKEMHINGEIVINAALWADMGKSIGLKKSGKSTAETDLIDRVAIVITDENGRILSFDNEGFITEPGESSNPIISFQRVVKKEGNLYEVINHQGERAVQTPGELSKFYLHLTIEEIEKMQQEEFAELYNLQQRVKKGETVDLSILDLSAGMIVDPKFRLVNFNDFVASRGKDLSPISILSLMQYVDNPIDNFVKGQTFVTIKGQKYLIKTPFVTANIAQDIIDVFNNPKISPEQKHKFHSQFFNNPHYTKLKENNLQKHSVSYISESNTLLFNYFDGRTTSTITLKEGESLTSEKENIIRNVFLNSVNNGPAKMHFMSEANQKEFMIYKDGKLKKDPSGKNGYLNLLLSLDLQLDTVNGPVNSYIIFSEKTDVQKAVEKQEQVEQPTPASEKESGDLEKVSQQEVNKYKESHATILKALQEGSTVEVSFIEPTPNSSTRYGVMLNVNDSLISTEIFSKETQPDITNPGSISLNITEVNTKDGVISDAIELIQNGKRIGFIRVSSNQDFARKEHQTQQPQAKPATDTNVNKGSDSQKIDGVEFDLERSKELSSKASKKEIDAAKSWWENSPLSKYIQFNVLADVVNSDAFAKFLIDGSTLVSPEMLARIEIYKDGNMTDVYHEAWHGFSQLFLTKAEKKSLYDEVRKNNAKYKDYTDAQVEELLAEDFRKYAKNQKPTKDSPKKNNIFRRMWNFLMNLFGKVRNFRSSQALSTPSVKELYDKLYFASKNPSLLAQYKPSLENVMFKEMNSAKAIASVSTGKRYTPVLSVSDSVLVSDTLDSMVSTIVDEHIKDDSKAIVLSILRGKNKEGLYTVLRNRLEGKLNNYKTELAKSKKEVGNENVIKFNDLTTVNQIKAAAPIIITRKDGVEVYGFLSSQIESMENLKPDLKRGDKVKGQVYHNINIVTDFYKHANLKVKNDKKQTVSVPIIVGSSIQELRDQYLNFAEDAVSKTWVSIEEKNVNLPTLTAEQTVIQDNIRILETALANWGDAKTGVRAYHQANSRFEYLNADKAKQEELDEEGNEIDITEEEGNQEDFADRKQGKKAVWAMAHPEIKYLVKSLHKLNPTTQKPILNKLGEKELADHSFIWAHLVKHLTGIQSPKKMYDTLVDLVNTRTGSENKYVIPELKQLIKKLPNPDKATVNSNSFDLASAFFHSFNKTEAPYLQTTFIQQPDGTFETHILESSMKESTVLAQWANKFRYGLVENDFIGEVNGIRTLILQNILKNPGFGKDGKLNAKNSYYFLQAIGIKLDDVIALKEELVNNSNYYGVKSIYEALAYALNLEQSKTTLSKEDQQIINDLRENPIKILSSEYTLNGRVFSNRTNMQRLAKLQVERGIEAYSQGVPNAAGDNVFPHIENNAITRIVNALNDGNSLTEVFENNPYVNYLNPANNPYTERLQIIKKLFDVHTGDRLIDRSIQAFMNSGTHIVYNKDTNEGVNTTDLDGRSYLLQNIHSLLLAGVQEMPRHASKKTSMGLRTSDGSLYISVKDLAQQPNAETELIQSVIIPHIAAEFDRIREFKANRGKYQNYTGYNTPITYADGTTVLAGEIFTAFDNVLTKDTKEKLYNLITDELAPFALEDILDSEQYSNLQNQVISDVKNFFQEMTNDTNEFLGYKGFIAKNLLEQTGVEDTQYSKEVVLKAFSYNSFIHNFETAVLVYGDMAQYNHMKEELHKRNTGSTSGGPGFRTDTAAKAFINGKWAELSYAASQGITPINYTGVLNTAVIRDNEVDKSIYLDDIEKGLREYYTNLVLPDGSKLSKKQVDDYVKADTKPYTGMEEGDGAGYVNIDTYRNLKKLENDWSEAQEALFQKMINNEELNPADVVEMFPPYKLQNFGHMAIEGLPALGMHKFALFPLIPNVIKNSYLEQLQKQMLEKDVDYVTFKTGSKGVTLTSDGKADRIFNDDGTLMENIEFTSNPVYVEYLKKSTSVNEYFKGSTVYATQKRGLLLNHLYDQGIPKSERLGALGRIYQEKVKDYSRVVKLELLNEIGYKYNSETDTYTGNHTKFIELVNNELEARDVPKHLLEAINVDLNGYVSNDLSYHISADKIEQVLVSLIEKRLTKQKVKGESLVQMPATMFNGIWDQTPEVLGANDPRIKSLIGTNNLPFYNRGEYDPKTKTYGKTGKMRIAISLQGPFLKLLEAEYKGQKIGDVDTLNTAIKDSEWLQDNEELVTLVGDRIPIQDHGSLEAAQVHHFFPANMSNIVVVPTEMVAKAGSDFDVDKVFWQYPEISNDGKLVTSQYSLEQLEKMLADPKTAAKAKKEIKIKKQQINNELIKANIDILTDPDVYSYLIKPNNTYLWTELASEMEKYYDNEYNRYKTYHKEGDREILDKKGNKTRMISPTVTLTPLYQVHKLSVNMVGKDGLGIVALENKIHPILKSIGYKMPKEFTVSLDGNFTPIKIPFSLMLQHNKTKDGNISLSNDYNVDGEKIADLNSHLMNGLVDVEKDAWVFYVRANLEQLPLMNFLIQVGAKRKEIVYLLSQPSIREYIEQNLEAKSLYTKIEITDERKRSKYWQIYNQMMNELLDSRVISDMMRSVNYNRNLTVLKSLKPDDVVYQGERAIKVSAMLEKYEKNSKTKFAEAFSYRDLLYKYNKNLANSSFLPFVEQYLQEYTGIKTLDVSLLKDGLEGEGSSEAQALFLTHYLNLNNQIKAHNETKRLFNPDTKVSKSAVMSFSRKEMLETAKQNPNVDLESLNKIEKESVLSSFFSNDISNALLKPLFALRLEPKIMQHAYNASISLSGSIKRKFKTKDWQSIFFSSYGNAVITTIYQNNLSYNMDENGNIITLPSEYKGMEVIKDPKSDKGVKLDVGRIIINERLLSQNYTEKANKDVFPNFQLFAKYSLEGAIQRAMYPELSAIELDRRAKMFAFNPYSMFQSKTGYSQKLLELVSEHDLKAKFSVLNNLQLAQAPSRKNYFILTLANRRDIPAELATEYANQLQQLADPTVMKVKDKALNYQISEYFSIFPDVLVYQHGFGFSRDGINSVLPQTRLMREMADRGQKFLDNKIEKGADRLLGEMTLKLIEFNPVQDFVAYDIAEYQAEGETIELIDPLEDDTDVSELIQPDEGPVSAQRELTPQEQKMLDSTKGKFVTEIKTLSGKSVLSFGIMQGEWESLSDREKIKFLNCN
jgi:hypothetical protein